MWNSSKRNFACKLRFVLMSLCVATIASITCGGGASFKHTVPDDMSMLQEANSNSQLGLASSLSSFSSVGICQEMYGNICSFLRIFAGRELYPRLGEKFDIKTWTNCRMGMMSWAILPLCYIVKQQQLFGEVQNSIIVSVALMEIYCFKFFL